VHSNDRSACTKRIVAPVTDTGAIDMAGGSRARFGSSVQPADRVLRRRDRFAAVALRLRRGQQLECARNDERASHKPGLAHV
jgi:hypothetical protein